LADKLDNLVSFNLVGEVATGSRDPFALRRAALALISLILINGLRFELKMALVKAWSLSVNTLKEGIHDPETKAKVQEALDLADADLDSVSKFRAETLSWRYDPIEEIQTDSFLETEAFIIDRLKVQQREAGVRHDLIDAVFALGGEDDLVRLLARVKALQSFLGSYDGANLLAGYKRAANILKKEEWDKTRAPAQAGAQSDGGGKAESSELDSGLRRNTLSHTPEPEEAVLHDALDSAESEVAAAIEIENFKGAMAALSGLRKPIDAFFEKVTVNDEDPAKRAARLAMLARFRDAVHKVADFSKIEG
jgi:glycyl-tRNA synthetase beta chain